MQHPAIRVRDQQLIWRMAEEDPLARRRVDDEIRVPGPELPVTPGCGSTVCGRKRLAEGNGLGD
jgi:hypothetical protein